MVIETRNITRIEVINQNGRELVHHDLKNVDLQLQDDGKTLKMFIIKTIK